jgi:hypothetical protein
MRSWPWMRQQKPMPVSQTTTPLDQDYESYNVYSQLLNRNGQWIGVADTKAAVVLGFLVTTFSVFTPPALLIVPKEITSIIHNQNVWLRLSAICFITLFILFLVTAVFILLHVLMTLLPRLKRQGQSSLIFFCDIACQDYKQWLKSMLALDPQMLALQVLDQVYETASIATVKHKHVRQAIRALIVMILLGLILYVISHFMS